MVETAEDADELEPGLRQAASVPDPDFELLEGSVLEIGVEKLFLALFHLLVPEIGRVLEEIDHTQFQCLDCTVLC